MSIKYNSKIFVVSGPGGAGKTTLVNKLLRKKSLKNSLIKGITVTTRHKRPREKEGRDYFFVSQAKFLDLKRRGFLLESQKIVNNYYGTPKKFWRQAKDEKKDLVLCIDVKGGMYLKKHFKLGRIVTIFISAPTEHELLSRLRKRADSPEIITERIHLAKKELCYAKHYDYLVINSKIEETLKTLETIFLDVQKRR
jgi:guanylate kinase